MAPQKSSLYKRTMQSSPRTESINDNSSEDPSEIEFEQQILWCIKKLELMRESEKLNQKKLQEAIKGISLLKSQKTIKIKKCHFMKTFFGDYKKKIQDELSKSAPQHSVEFKISATPEVENLFFKKYKHQESAESEKQEFFFNFHVETQDILDLNNLQLS